MKHLNFRVNFAMSLLLSLTLLSCASTGLSSNSSIQGAGGALIDFVGDVYGAEVIIDSSAPIRMDSVRDATGNATQFRVEPGKHKIIVVKNGQTVVQKAFIMSDGQTIEVLVP